MSALGRLLIVDDEVELMTALSETLTQHGYETQGFTSGAEALAALRAGSYDILLADLMMPGVDGITLLRKCLEVDPQLIGIIMTGQGTVTTAVEAMQVGAFDYILKPFKRQTLIPILTRAIEVRRLRLENMQLRDTLTIYDLSQTIALTLDPQKISEQLLDAALKQSEGDEASVLLSREDGLYVAAVRGTGRSQIPGTRIPFEPSIAGWVAQTQHPLLLSGEVNDERFAPLFPRDDIHSSVSIPMLAAGKLVGVLNVNTLRARPFASGQVKALSVLANTAAAAIEQGSLFRALQQSEERFRVALKDSPIVVFNHDRDLRYTWIYNPALGYRADEVIGYLDSDIFAPESAERLIALKRRVLESGAGIRQEIKVVAKDESQPHYYDLTVEPLRDGEGGVIGITCAALDITERKVANEALQHSQERLQALIENSTDGIALINTNGVIRFASPATTRILGYSLKEFVGMNSLDLIHPDDAEEAAAVIRDVIQKPRHIRWSEYRARHKDGRWRWLSGSVQNLLADPGIKALIINYRDVTEGKQAEAEILQHNRELAALNQIGQQLSKLAQPDEIWDVLHGAIEQLFDNRNLYVALYDEPHNTINFPLYTVEGQRFELTSRPLGSGLTEYILRTGAPLLITRNMDDTMKQLGIESIGRPAACYLGVPIFIGQRAIGVMAAQDYEKEEVYALRHVDLMMTIAAQTAIALENARLLSETRRRLRETLLLNRVIAATTSTIELNAILQTTCDELAKGFSLQQVLIALITSDPANYTVVVEHVPQPQRAMIGFNFKLKPNSVRYQNLKQGQPFISLDAPRDNRLERLRLLARRRGVTSLLAIPLFIRESQQIGLIVLASAQRRKFMTDEIILAQNVAATMSQAIEKSQLFEETRRRLIELEAVNRISSALRTAQSLDEMLPRLLDETLTTLDTTAGTIVLHDPARSLITPVVARGWLLDIYTPNPYPSNVGITGKVITTGEIFVTREAASDSELREDLRAIVPAGWGGATVPIYSFQTIVGVMYVSVKLPREITVDEIRLLQTVADIAGNAIHRTKLHEQTQRRAEQLAAVNTLGQALAETLEVEQIYERLYLATTQLLPHICGMVVSHYEASTHKLISDYGRVDGKRLEANQLPVVTINPDGKGPQTEALTTRRPLIVNDLQARLPQASVHIPLGETPVPKSGLYIPMLIKGEIFGTMVVQSYTPDRFTKDEADLLLTVANTTAVALENARLFGETNRRLQYLQAMRTIDSAITASLDLRVTLNVLLEQITAQLKVDASSILLLNSHSHILEYAAGRGFYTQGITRARLRLGEGHAGRAALERRLISEPDMRVINQEPARAQLLAGEGFVSYYGLPLIAKGQVKGVLDVFSRSVLKPDSEWMEFLETLANQAAIAIDGAQLFEDLQRSNTELSLAYDATIEGWSRALDLRDKETEGHSQRVAEMTIQLARATGAFNELDLIQIRRGALLHDIGKMGIPDQILLKTGQLSEQEWAIMRQHPTYAYELLSPIAYLRPALDIPYSHHEKWDGTGYPRGLKGEQIPMAARIFAVVDVWDALRSDRPYRSAWPAAQVREHIHLLAGSHFDPHIAAIFLETFKD